MKQLMLIIITVFSINIVFGNVSQLGDAPIKKSIFDLISYQDVQKVTIEFNIDEMIANTRSEESFKGKFSFVDQNGVAQTWKMKVELRGRFRRTHCSEMPPIKLNFKKGDLAEAGLSLHDDFKLVTQCIEDEEEAKNALFKEFLAYRMYNELTDYSFKVQLLKIDFKDAVSGKVKKQWGFIIEDTAQMRSRLEGEKFEAEFGIKNNQYSDEHRKRVALFEYMIGNLDYDMYKKVHNVKLIKKSESLIPIPYDFDFSAIVSAPYAILNPNFGVKSIKDRLYLGVAEDLANMKETRDLFLSKKEAMLSLVRNFKLLKREERIEILYYLKSFYKEIDDIKLPVLNQSTNLTISD